LPLPHLDIQYWTPNFHNWRTIGAELNIEGWRKLRTGVGKNTASMVGPCESLLSALIANEPAERRREAGEAAAL